MAHRTHAPGTRTREPEWMFERYGVAEPVSTHVQLAFEALSPPPSAPERAQPQRLASTRHGFGGPV